MKEKPILFSAPMVTAILEGRKTQTRRILNHEFTEYRYVEFNEHENDLWKAYTDDPTQNNGECQMNDVTDIFHCPYGSRGDRLWVRETWQTHCDMDSVSPRDLPSTTAVQYPATYDHWVSKKRPSIFMPRWASRITLEITNVRVERLQDISDDDAYREGISPDHIAGDREVSIIPGSWITYSRGFAVLWDTINGKRASWESNPWVWVIEFRKLEQGK